MITYEIEKLYKKYDNVRKHANRIGKVLDFFAKTMSFWPKYYKDSCTKILQSPFLNCPVKRAIKEDLLFF